ncbi:hypothetical protein D8674_036477 [Pyrus ussuriensis x Pyrus communis]|uniref:Helicase C-terminal domain-containing protein n=1 Tax=Pyrus ussuriensis x Pyrus communis TaxID=2448454 RepID=A0A5N5GJX0_9ROSA|nr:hypothetical protein D8674_036477 [Pyrus ussuriensis x Pyrus communis]
MRPSVFFFFFFSWPRPWCISFSVNPAINDMQKKFSHHFHSILCLLICCVKVVTINLSFSFADTDLTMEKGGRNTRSDIRMHSILLRSSWRILSGFVKTIIVSLFNFLYICSPFLSTLSILQWIGNKPYLLHEVNSNFLLCGYDDTKIRVVIDVGLANTEVYRIITIKKLHSRNENCKRKARQYNFTSRAEKFGVKQKEKIASFKTSVDVLTLSATPIPRTLYLALTGFRDVSLISTPPPERVPIKSHLSAYSKEKVLSAIKHELERGGQVFYVLPRIKGLEEVMKFLEQSFPNVEIAIAHGKQYSKQLEETMENFAQGEIKILICTNIVESGLDIQNANTIIIQDVQQFGLAQLYQLRGRVGRADKEAHAYLFYPEKSLLTDQALVLLVPYRILSDLQLLRNAVNLGKVSNLQRRTWESEALVPYLVSNKQGMLEMLALISSLKCSLRAYPRFTLMIQYFTFYFLFPF